MKITLPIKSLIGINWLLTVVFSGIVCLFLFQNKTEQHPILYTFMTALAITIISYANIYVIIYLSKKYELNSPTFRLYRCVLTYIISAITYLIVWPIFAFFSKKEWEQDDYVLLLTFILSSVLINTLILVLQDFVLLHTQKAHTELELSKLKTAHAEAANSLLQQQIHPHFLFNSLNTVKSLYKKDPFAGDTYIVHLANFLRASIFTQSTKVSKLEVELALLKDYLEMQKFRFGSALCCLIMLPDEIIDNYYLPSFSLQPLLENAIKHNELTEEAPLRIVVWHIDDRIIVSNNLQRKAVKLESTNNGLANLSERYRLLSNDEVIIKEEDKVFSVSIKLLSNEYSNHRR